MIKKPMLASKLTEPQIQQIRFPVLLSPKLDGVRMSVQRTGGKIVCLSRSLKPIPNKFTQQAFAIPELVGVDGELIVGDPVAAHVCDVTRAGVMARAGVPDVKWWGFDFVAGICAEPFQERLSKAHLQIAKARSLPFTTGLRAHPLHHVMCHSLNELMSQETRYLKMGYEGIMGRDPLGLHKQGRSTVIEGGLWAIKRFTDAEAVVIGFEEQMENTNPQTVNELGRSKRSTHKSGKVGKGTLGALVCAHMTNPAHGDFVVDMTKERFNIGTGEGLTDALRAQLWAQRKKLVGRIVKYKSQTVGAKDAPRIPLFIGFRDERDL